MVLAKDTSFGQVKGVLSAADTQPLIEIKHFNWKGMWRGKGAHYYVENDGHNIHALLSENNA